MRFAYQPFSKLADEISRKSRQNSVRVIAKLLSLERGIQNAHGCYEWEVELTKPNNDLAKSLLKLGMEVRHG